MGRKFNSRTRKIYQRSPLGLTRVGHATRLRNNATRSDGRRQNYCAGERNVMRPDDLPESDNIEDRRMEHWVGPGDMKRKVERAHTRLRAYAKRVQTLVIELLRD